MAVLVNPATYISVATFKTMASDYDLTGYTDTQLQDILVRASGAADSMMRKSHLARERSLRFYGDGTNRLELYVSPLLYVKRVQLALPGSYATNIPIDQILVDYRSGSLLEYTPILWQTSQGYFSRFPEGAPVDVTFATGYGYTYATAPTCTFSDISGGGLTPGQYDIAVTTQTMWGETIATPQTVTTTTGNIQITVTGPSLGAYKYRVYIAPHGTTPLKLVNESAFTAYGMAAMIMTVNSLTPQQGLWADVLPTTDTSAPVLPNGIVEAVRLLALSSIYEQNNLSNRGIAKTQSGQKAVMWRSTEGNSGRGVPLYVDQAREYLKPYSLQAIF